MYRMKSMALTIVLLASIVTLATAKPADASPASPGDLLVIDPDAGTLGNGALFTVDPSTGSRTILSDFGNVIQGPTGLFPAAFAIDSSGTILVIDRDAGTGGKGALFTVDPSTGSRTILSDFGDATQGPTGVDTHGIAIESSGTILVIDPDAGTGGNGALFTVDPSDGSRAILSDFGNVTQGPTGLFPVSLAIESSGTILVIDENAGTGFAGALFTVDPADGSRTILSDFGNAIKGPIGVEPHSIAIESSGTILVIDPNAGGGGLGALFTVDPSTGSRTIRSDFGNAIQGPLGSSPFGIAIFPVVAPPQDNVAPNTAITSAVDGKNKPIANGTSTGSASIKFTFTGSDDVAVSGFECSLDGAVFSACSSPASYINLNGGTHTFQVRAVDTSGNKDASPATFSWFIAGKRFK